MKLTRKSRCGTRVLMDLARNCDQGPVPAGDISRRQAISVKYLEQIIHPLRKAGLIKSSRGPKGGHCLGKRPEAIAVGEIVRLLETHSELAECVGTPEYCERSDECRIRLVWEEATDTLFAYLNSVTILDLITNPDPGI
jgi:Rrf2 family iron-sulfur cluster assembly transcriptional regulator